MLVSLFQIKGSHTAPRPMTVLLPHEKTLFASTHDKHTRGFISAGHRFCLEHFHTSKNKFKNASGGISKGKSTNLPPFGERKEEKGADYLYTWSRSRHFWEEGDKGMNTVCFRP